VPRAARRFSRTVLVVSNSRTREGRGRRRIWESSSGAVIVWGATSTSVITTFGRGNEDNVLSSSLLVLCSVGGD